MIKARIQIPDIFKTRIRNKAGPDLDGCKKDVVSVDPILFFKILYWVFSTETKN
jgi:hypothetical protein